VTFRFDAWISDLQDHACLADVPPGTFSCMATTKKKPAPTTPKPSPRTPAPVKANPKPPAPAATKASDTEEAWEPSKARLLLSRLRPRWSTLTPAEIADFDSLSTDAQRSALGARTKARGVAADATRWAASIDRQLRDYAVVREHHEPKRFAYYLLRLEALVAEIGNQGTRKSAQGTAKTGAATAIVAARAARAKLLLALERYAGNRQAENDQIKAALKSGTEDDAVVESLRDLVTLAASWLKTGSAFLLHSARLTPALLDEVRLAAEQLASAGASATEAGPAPARDSPAVNLVEGWLLEEMIRVRDDFEAAHKESQIIERLIPGAATRAIFGSHPKKALPAKAPSVPAGTP
jgi:hypothetical protein